MSEPMDKREFLIGLGAGAAGESPVTAQEAASTNAGGFRPRCHNKVIEFLENGQPVY